ncbi:MAG: hypothetical protein WC783_01595 [Candidatus Paceibacterota bacterium]|jgi:hypothetical protein
MSYDEEEVGGEFNEGLDEEELLEPLDDNFEFEDEEEQDKN